MNENRRQRVEELFCAAADLEPGARDAFLDDACKGDSELRREIESLLSHDHERRDAFDDAQAGLGGKLLARAVTADDTATAGTDAATPLLPHPERIGHYRITAKIGEGGMGTVYAAEQDHPRRRVALKMIRPGVLSRSLLRRFQQEAELLGRLQHPGIAQIYEAGALDTEAGQQPYFAMEFVEGLELRSYAGQHELGIRERLELVARVCEAVHHAHQKGIIHRDLKPDNVLVVEEATPASLVRQSSFVMLGQPKVLDFGVARATDSDIQVTTLQTDVGQLIGTVPYMSPEQIAGDTRELDTRSDIYALGVMLYELLSGRLPFDLRRKSIPEAARMIREDEPTRLSSIQSVYRGDIDTIVSKALEKDPGRRYQSAAELAADIRHYLANEPITARPPSTFYQLSKFAKRNKGLVAGLGVAVLILLAGIVSSLTLATRALKGERRAIVSETASRRAAYKLSITAADAVGGMDPLQALRQLQAAPPEYRGWEWYHLLARHESQSATHMGDRRTEYAFTIARQDDGTLVVALERGGAIELIDLDSGEVRAVFRDQGGLTSPNLSTNGLCLAAASPARGNLIVWSVPEKERLLELPVGSLDVRCTRFSPDGSLIALISREQGLSIRETSTGRVRFQTPLLPGYNDIIAFDIEGLRVAVVDQQSGGHFALKVLSATGEQLASKGLTDGCMSVVFKPDGTRLALGQTQRMIRVLDADTLEVLNVLRGHAGPVTALAYSPDGAYLASSSTDGTTQIWDAHSDTLLRVLAGGNATSLAFAQDNAVLGAGSSAEARRWNWAHSAHLTLRGHKRHVYLVAFSPDPGVPELLASSSWDNTVRLWDPLTGEMLGVLETVRCYRALSFTPDGNRLVAFDESQPHLLAVWDVATGLRLTTPRTASDEPLFEALQRQEPYWQFRYGRCVAGGAKAAPNKGENFALSCDRSLMAHGLDAGGIGIVDVATGETIKHVGKHDGGVFAVAFSPNTGCVVTGGEDHSVRVWDLAGDVELATMNGHAGDVYSVVYSPDGTRIVSGGNDETIRIWSPDTFEQVGELRGHESYVHSVAFSSDGTMLASGSGDGTVRIWDSVSPAQRWQQIQEAKTLRRKAEPLVDGLLAKLGDPLEVADHLRAEDTLSDSLRRAALRVLLQRSMASHSNQH